MNLAQHDRVGSRRNHQCEKLSGAIQVPKAPNSWRSEQRLSRWWGQWSQCLLLSVPDVPDGRRNLWLQLRSTGSSLRWLHSYSMTGWNLRMRMSGDRFKGRTKTQQLHPDRWVDFLCIRTKGQTIWMIIAGGMHRILLGLQNCSNSCRAYAFKKGELK